MLPATIDGIRAHFGNPTQITLLRMSVSAGSLHEKTVHNADLVQWPQTSRCPQRGRNTGPLSFYRRRFNSALASGEWARRWPAGKYGLPTSPTDPP